MCNWQIFIVESELADTKNPKICNWQLFFSRVLFCFNYLFFFWCAFDRRWMTVFSRSSLWKWSSRWWPWESSGPTVTLETNGTNSTLSSSWQGGCPMMLCWSIVICVTCSWMVTLLHKKQTIRKKLFFSPDRYTHSHTDFIRARKFVLQYMTLSLSRAESGCTQSGIHYINIPTSGFIEIILTFFFSFLLQTDISNESTINNVSPQTGTTVSDSIKNAGTAWIWT